MSQSGLPVYNVVTDYSADKTGGSDAKTAIQNAIDAAELAGGGIVFFPVGIYKLTGALELKSRVHLLGESGQNAGGVVLKPSHTSVYAITGVDTTGEWFEIAGDHAAEYPVGRAFVVSGSTGNNGGWTVSAVSYNGGTGKTRITVTGNITNSTADGAIEQHFPVLSHRGASITDFSIKHIVVSFDNCKSSSLRAGVASLDSEDVGIEIAGGFLYEIEDVYVTLGYHAYKSYVGPTGNGGFLGRLKNVWSQHCRNGFKHYAGTCMVFEQCWAHYWNATDNSLVASDMDKAFDFQAIYGLALISCAIDHWGSGSGRAFVADGVHGLVIDGMDHEWVDSKGGDVYYFNNSEVSIRGCTEIYTTLRTNDNAQSMFVRSNNSSLHIDGCSFGGSPKEYAMDMVGGNGVSEAVVVGIPAGGVSAVSIAGSKIYAPINSRTFAVTGVDTTAEWFEVSGDWMHRFEAGKTFTVTGSTGNNGTWTVSSASRQNNPIRTRIVVTGNITSSVADGTINLTMSSGFLTAFGDWSSSSSRVAVTGTPGIDPNRLPKSRLNEWLDIEMYDTPERGLRVYCYANLRAKLYGTGGNANHAGRLELVDGGVLTAGLRIGSSGTPGYALHLTSDSAAKSTTSTWTVTSDEKVKRNLRPFTSGLDVLERVNLKTWEFNGLGDTPKGQTASGVIAQELYEVLPEAVVTKKHVKAHEDDSDEAEYWGVNFHLLLLSGLNAVKELSAEVKGLKARLNALGA